MITADHCTARLGVHYTPQRAELHAETTRLHPVVERQAARLRFCLGQLPVERGAAVAGGLGAVLGVAVDLGLGFGTGFRV